VRPVFGLWAAYSIAASCLIEKVRWLAPCNVSFPSPLRDSAGITPASRLTKPCRGFDHHVRSLHGTRTPSSRRIVCNCSCGSRLRRRHRSTSPPAAVPASRSCQHVCCRLRRATACQYFGLDLNPSHILLAHTQPTHLPPPTPRLRMGQRHLGFSELRHYCFTPTALLCIITVTGLK
jgi:hypothetical protein